MKAYGLERTFKRYFRFAEKHALLDKVSLAYIFAPVFLWAFGWLRLYYAVPLCGLLLWGAYLSVRTAPRQEKQHAEEEVENCSYTSLGFGHLALLLLACIIVLSTGWGFGAKIGDFFKHQAFLRDLSEYEWPIGYSNMGENGQPGILTAYMGFYLVPAFIGKFLGWAAAWYATLLWILLGTYLTFAWISRCMGKVLLWVAVLFMFFGGLDILGWLLIPNQLLYGDLLLEWWHLYFGSRVAKEMARPVYWAYGNNLITHAWAPHHVLPGWIVLFMVFHDSLRSHTSKRTLFLAAAVPLSSFFCAVGLLPFVLTSLCANKVRKAITPQNLIIAPLLVCVTGLYFASNRGDFDIGPLWHFQSLNDSWITLLIFYTVEFGFYMAVCWICGLRPVSRELRIYGRVAILVLLALPWCVFGNISEIVVKGAIPALAILPIYLASCIKDSVAARNGLQPATRLLIVLLLVGTLGAFSHLQFSFHRNGGFTKPVPELSSVLHINGGKRAIQKATKKQLMSDGDSFFWRHLAKPPVLQE